MSDIFECFFYVCYNCGIDSEGALTGKVTSAHAPDSVACIQTADEIALGDQIVTTYFRIYKLNHGVWEYQEISDKLMFSKAM